MASRWILHIITTFYFLLLLLSPAYAQTGDNNGQSSANPYGLNTNFNPSLAIIIVVLISAFFFMGFFSIYIRQCTGDRRTGGSVRPTTIARSRRAPLGLDPAVIDTFPTFLYSDVKGLKIGKGALECAVCLSEFEDNETLRLLPKCDHVFHPDCIDAWLASHTTCPVCRSVLLPESGETDTNTVVDAVDNDSSAAAAAASVTQAPDDENRGSETNNNNNNSNNEQEQQQQQQQVSVSVTISVRDDHHEAARPAQNRPARTRIGGKFPRSHSTGHSVVQPGENWERYRLRLPEEVRKQIVNGKLNRARSCAGMSAGDGSVNGGSYRRGYRGGGEGSSRGRSLQFLGAKSDRWVFSMAPPFFSRTESVKSPRMITDGEGSGNGRNLFTSVKTPFDCMSGKGGAAEEEESSARPPV